MVEGAYLAVARFRKPHGLKGEALLFPLTDEPQEVFVPGQVLVPVDDDGKPTGAELTIQHARPHQRQWLVAFEGIDDRTTLEQWSAVVLGAMLLEFAPDRSD